jgi:hypothetical protein
MLCAREVGTVELVDDFSRGFHDVHCTRRVRMAAQRHLVVTDRQLHFLAIDRCYRRVFDLTSHMLPRLIGVPWSGIGQQHILKLDEQRTSSFDR